MYKFQQNLEINANIPWHLLQLFNAHSKQSGRLNCLSSSTIFKLSFDKLNQITENGEMRRRQYYGLQPSTSFNKISFSRHFR